jgi:hypothetical protein
MVSAGLGTYRINPEVTSPTKARCIMGGLPIHLISLQREPLYETPLLVACCKYNSPFINEALKIDIDLPIKPKNCDTKQFMKPEWIEITYLPTWRILESNGFEGLFTAL